MLHLRNFFALLALGILMLPKIGSANMSMGLGVKGGVNFANATIKDGIGKKVNTNSLTGFSLGGLIELGVNTPFSLLLEPTYVKNGATFADFSGKGEFTYFQIPVLLKAKFGTPDIYFFLFAGPNFGFNLSAEGTASAGIFTATWNAKDDIDNMDIMGDVGAGLSFSIAPHIHASADARYSHGFTNIINKNSKALDNWMSRDIKLMAGLTFEFPE